MPFKFDNTLGAMLIGCSLSMSLWGVACVQTYNYYFLNNEDGRLQKSVVALLLVLNTFNVITTAEACYHYLVTNYANPFALLDRPWGLNMIGVAMGFTTTIIRTMFAHRIYQFGGKNKVIPTWIMLLTIVDLVAALILTSKCFSNISSIVLQQLNLTYICFAFGLAADISITIALTWLLQSAKTGFRRSDSILNALIIYVMNTGILVTFGGAVGLILFLAMPDFNMIYYGGSLHVLIINVDDWKGVFMVYNKLYVNGYLASLNARSRLRIAEPILDSYPLSGVGPRGMAFASGDKTSSDVVTPTLAVSLHTTVESIVDDYKPSTNAV